MSDKSTYSPPNVWTWDKENGGKFANINRPIAGATHERELPVGRHPLQIYSQGTPNGVKVTVMLEELLELGYEGAEYDAWLIRISHASYSAPSYPSSSNSSSITVTFTPLGVPCE